MLQPRENKKGGRLFKLLVSTSLALLMLGAPLTASAQVIYSQYTLPAVGQDMEASEITIVYVDPHFHYRSIFNSNPPVSTYPGSYLKRGIQQHRNLPAYF